MKKLILAALAVGSIATTTQAQKAGSILIYGDLGFSAQNRTLDPGPSVVPNETEIKTVNIHFMPGVGYQLNKNWTVGLNLGVGVGREKTEGPGNTRVDPITTSTDVMIGPFVRMTTPINRTFFVFNQLNVSYLGSKVVEDYVARLDQITYQKGIGAVWFPAVGVNFTKCMALNFSIGGLGFSSVKETYNNGNNASEVNTQFGLTFGRQFNLGISANLGGKRGFSKRDPGMEHRRHMDMDDDDAEIKVRKKKVSVEDED